MERTQRFPIFAAFCTQTATTPEGINCQHFSLTSLVYSIKYTWFEIFLKNVIKISILPCNFEIPVLQSLQTPQQATFIKSYSCRKLLKTYHKVCRLMITVDLFSIAPTSLNFMWSNVRLHL